VAGPVIMSHRDTLRQQCTVLLSIQSHKPYITECHRRIHYGDNRTSRYFNNVR